MRGPVATKIINQLALCTTWGELDYLIIDLPPGTGDVQLTLGQSLRMSGLCVVTTPHPLSLADAAKGIEMFEQLKVPTLAIVENMSYFTCDHGKKHFPFGVGGRDKLLRYLAGDHLQTCPMLFLPLSGNNGSDGQYPQLLEYHEVADAVVQELFKVEVSASSTPSVSLDNSKKLFIMRYFTSSRADELSCPMWEIRRRDAKTGAVSDADSLRLDYLRSVEITTVEQKGHYGVAFVWSDGHYADIFPFDVLRQICEEVSRSKA